MTKLKSAEEWRMQFHASDTDFNEFIRLVQQNAIESMAHAVINYCPNIRFSEFAKSEITSLINHPNLKV